MRDPIYLIYRPTEQKWELSESYRLDLSDCSLLIPQGFVFEASVPGSFEPIFPARGLGILGPLAHDFIYTHDGKMPVGSVEPHRRFSRAQADRIFLSLMKEEKVSLPRRYLAYWAVRAFGRSKWKGREK